MKNGLRMVVGILLGLLPPVFLVLALLGETPMGRRVSAALFVFTLVVLILMALPRKRLHK